MKLGGIMMKLRKYLRRLFIYSLLLSSLNAKDISEILNQKVSVSFAGASIPEVLQIFAKQYSLNLVVSDDIIGRITLQLDNVSLEDALNAILKSHGYHYIIEDDVLIVKSFEQDVNGELTTQVFSLDYLDGIFLLATIQPLLSTKGRAEALISEQEEAVADQRSDLLIVTDLWENINEIKQVISSIDVPSAQLQIEVRLVERIVSNEKRVGLKLPTSVGVSVQGAESTAPLSGNETNVQKSILSAWYQIPQNGSVTWGVLTVDELRATLEFLATDDNSRLVSNPKVTTLNNKKALIRVGTTVPIQEISRGVGGDVISFREKEVDMNLLVIPRVSDDGKITMQVHPIMEEIIGFTGPSDFPQPITSKREVQTTVTVKDGETVVIGGLLKESNSKNVEKVWLLGDIPLLGKLFRHTTTKKEKSDLLIFITPKILER